MRRFPSILLVVVLFAASMERGSAADRFSVVEEEDNPVAVRVGDQEIRLLEVRGEVRRLGWLPDEDETDPGDDAPDPASDDSGIEDVVWAAALERLVDRHLGLLWLEQQGLAPTTADVELEIDRLERRLEQADRTLEEYLEQQRWDRRALERRLRWQLGWGRMLERYVTDANLERYFDENARDFDGTRLRVAHILFSVDEQPVDEVREQAADVRRRLVAEELSFADAAARFSVSPTGEQGGALGWIERHTPMVEAFNEAAFDLDVGDISEPVLSPAGIHLIQCLEVEPGERTWQQARRELIPAVRRYLFEWVADRQRPDTRVEYTGVVPYRDPETRALVLPSGVE